MRQAQWQIFQGRDADNLCQRPRGARAAVAYTRDEREGRVARVGNTENSRTEVAIEFAVPAPEFWAVFVPGTSLPIPENTQAVASATIAPTAAIPMQSAPYEWQDAVAEALREGRPEYLASKVAAAERAIAARLRDSNPPCLDERIALQESLQTLRVLTSQEEAAEFCTKKETA